MAALLFAYECTVTVDKVNRLPLYLNRLVLVSFQDGMSRSEMPIRGPPHISEVSLRLPDRLAGLVVKASASKAKDPGFESRLRRDFSGSSHTSGLKIGTPVATLPGAWHYRVRAGTGRPGVNILTGF